MLMSQNDYGVSVSHKSEGHGHDTHGHSTTSSSGHGEERHGHKGISLYTVVVTVVTFTRSETWQLTAEKIGY